MVSPGDELIFLRRHDLGRAVVVGVPQFMSSMPGQEMSAEEVQVKWHFIISRRIDKRWSFGKLPVAGLSPQGKNKQAKNKWGYAHEGGALCSSRSRRFSIPGGINKSQSD